MATIKIAGSIVTSISGSLGSIHAAMRRKPLDKVSVADPGIPAKRMRIQPRVEPPLRQAKRHIPDFARDYWYNGERCECMSYTIADYLWLSGKIDRAEWNAGVKIHGITGYGLWIKEATAAARLGRYYPDHPSISGGFTTDHVEPGVRFQPPADCLPRLAPELDISATLFAWGPPYRIHHLRFDWWYTPWNWPYHPLHRFTIRWFYKLDDPTVSVQMINPSPGDIVLNPDYPEQAATNINAIIISEPGIRADYYWPDVYPFHPWILFSMRQSPYGPYEAAGDWR